MAQELLLVLIRRKAEQALDLIRFHSFRRQELCTRYEAIAGRPLRSDLLRQLEPDTPLAKALAYLRYGADIDQLAARMGTALIKTRVRDDDAMRLLNEHSLSTRRKMAAEYEEVYAGVFGVDSLVLLGHLDRLTSMLSYKPVIRARILVERDLTPADELYFATDWWSGNQKATAEIVQAEWEKGPETFRRLLTDWSQLVRGVRRGVDQDLQEYVKARVSGEQRKLVLAVFDGYRRVTDGILSQEEAEVTVAEDSLAAAKGPWYLPSDDREVAKAARRLGGAADRLEEREKREPGAGGVFATAAGARRKARAAVGDGGDADAIEARIALSRELTLVDRICLALCRWDDDAVLDLLRTAWGKGTEAEVGPELSQPDPVRPRQSLGFRLTMHWSGSKQRQALALINPRLNHPLRGAMCLRAMLEGDPTSTASSDLKASYKWLKSMGDGERAALIAAYASVHLLGPQTGTAEDKFFHHILHGCPAFAFEMSVAKVDLLQLFSGENDVEDLLSWAHRRKKVDDAGRGAVSDAVVRLYDRVSGEDTQVLADEALLRLQDWVQKAQCRPKELQAVMAEEGVSDPRQLVERGFAAFNARLDEMRGVRGAGLEALGQVIDFVGRSALVFLLGPGAVPALVAALASYALGMMARESMLGSEYDLLSLQNLGTLVSEVGSSAFDFLKIEGAIQSALTPEHIAAFGKLAAIKEHGSKFTQELAKAGISKMFEKIPQNIAEGQPFPTAGEVGARAFHAMLLAGMKTGTAPLLRSPTLYDSYAERLLKQTQKTLANGPPPRSAPIYALGKEFTDMLAGWDGTSLETKMGRFVKASAVSVASTIPASFALTAVGHREARRMGKHLNETDITTAFHNDPAAFQAYAAVRERALRKGVEIPAPAAFLQAAAKAGTTYSYQPWTGGEGDREFDPEAFLTKTAANLDKKVEKPTFR